MQIREYETAEESAQDERRTADHTQRENLARLIDNLRHSRKVSIIKLIHLIEQMQDRGLWLTYRKSEQVSEVLTTPRGRDLSSSTKHIFLKRKGNPLA